MTVPWWLDELLYLLGALSILGVIATFALTPIVIVALPEDYFESTRPAVAPSQRHPVLRGALHFAKNVLGVVLLVSGAVMFFIPGPGLLTILFGVILTDIPGKRRVERRIVAVPVVHRALDRIRRRASRPPFRLEARDFKEHGSEASHRGGLLGWPASPCGSGSTSSRRSTGSSRRSSARTIG